MTRDEEQKLRWQFARIAALEFHYWATFDTEDLQQIAIGAMGAAANISAAIFRGVTAEQYEKEIATRDGNGLIQLGKEPSSL